MSRPKCPTWAVEAEYLDGYSDGQAGAKYKVPPPVPCHATEAQELTADQAHEANCVQSYHAGHTAGLRWRYGISIIRGNGYVVRRLCVPQNAYNRRRDAEAYANKLAQDLWEWELKA